MSRIDSTHSSAARPGVVSQFLDSSLTVRAVSQPQKPKIDPDSPAMNADRVRPAGVNHDQLKSLADLRAAVLGDCHDREDQQHDHLEDHQHDLHLLGGVDASVGDVGRYRQERQDRSPR